MCVCVCVHACYLHMSDVKVHHTCHVEAQTKNQKNHNQKTSAARDREGKRGEREGFPTCYMDVCCVMQ